MWVVQAGAGCRAETPRLLRSWVFEIFHAKMNLCPTDSRVLVFADQYPFLKFNVKLMLSVGIKLAFLLSRPSSQALRCVLSP